jgi:hypothetical protein
MKAILATAIIALAFTTGFTCSKNTPAEPTATPAAPTQEQMAAPAAAPTEGAPAAAPTEGTAAPTEAAPAAAPAPEAHK